METAKLLNSLALLFAAVGALNWGLAAFANMDLIAVVSGGSSVVGATAFGSALYAIVALFGLYTLWMFVQSLSSR
jgi:uncharacterized membrane protein YuzA (DUF378 family)